jgi:hypothetical protein
MPGLVPGIHVFFWSHDVLFDHPAENGC